ncbi:tyrosine-type recombinase/integrase [Nocardia jiangsuensis]|uniref:Tyrosine-type recombinase/integrase n=1 Tax=Nocardia jiangsuensis TaxID=1691563 RepID=A0ABV8DMT4_9NOCA
MCQLEADCFWAWALIETLRLTGARIEEVLELAQLSIRHYTPATTGTLVPLLHIAPSKTDIERLIPMSPELVEVLVAVQRRAKAGRGAIPLSVRHDRHERVHGVVRPHLFARPVGARQEVLSAHYVRKILNAAALAAGISDSGTPVAFTPHDFRRLFTTDAVGAGLPLHIVASLLGHLDLDTTRGYTAVFPDAVITHQQQFITHRRTLRASAEHCDATSAEWAEFEQHFLLRRVELGDCFRPYGTPCIHEHACVRCPFLRLDPTQAPRLDDMAANARDRLDHARDKQWLGEIDALQQTLRHIATKRRHLETTPH